MNKIALSIALAIIYFIAGKFGLLLAFVNQNSTAVWPPTGIAIASLLIAGYRVWPGIFLGAFLVNLTTAGTIATSLAIASGNTLESLLAAYLINRFASGKRVLDKPVNIFKYALLAGLLSTALSPIFGVTALALSGYAPLDNYWAIWQTWWLGDVGGAIIIAPVILSWRRGSLVRWNFTKAFEVFFVMSLFFIVSELAFGGAIGEHYSSYPLIFLFLPIFVWVAIRFSQLETSILVLYLAIKATLGTLLGYGPFVANTPNESLLFLQGFLSVMSLTAMSLSAAIMEGRGKEEELKTSKELYQKLIEASPDATILSDTKGIIRFVDSQTAALYGYSEVNELIGMDAFMLIAPEDHARTKKLMEALIEKGQLRNIEYVSVKKDGSRFIVEANASLFYNSQGKPQGIIAVIRDVTIRKLNESKLSELAAIVESSSDAILSYTLGGIITSWNKSAENLFGYTETEAIGKSIQIIIPTDRVQEAEEMFIKIKKGERVVQFETKRISRDHRIIDVSLTISPIKDNSNAIVGASVTARDISDRKQLEQMRSDFFWMATHQLRTPISSLRWNIELLLQKKEPELSPQVRVKLMEMKKKIEQMIEQIKEILTVSRLQLQPVLVKNERIDVKEVIDEVLKECDVIIRENNLKVTLDASHSPSYIVVEEKQRFKDIVENLLLNSVKYNKKGGEIVINVDVKENFLILSVKDTGIGIPQEDQAKLFTRFFRASNAPDAEGTGLGLSLIKAYVDNHRGKIWFESEEGKGSTFFIQLPLVK